MKTVMNTICAHINGWHFRRIRAQGVTLVELIITVSIAAILAAIAIPSFQSTIDRNRSASNTNEFLTSMYLARNEALTRRQRVVLCPSTDGTSCAGNGNWHLGWIVFVDLDNDAVVDTSNPVDTMLLSHDALSDTTLTDDIGDNYISYTADGSARTTAGVSQTGTLSFSLCINNKKTSITINITGRPKTSSVSC